MPRLFGAAWPEGRQNKIASKGRGGTPQRTESAAPSTSMKGLISTRDLITAVDALARQWLTHSVRTLAHPDAAGGVPAGMMRSNEVFQRKRLIYLLSVDNKNPGTYFDFNKPVGFWPGNAGGRSNLQSLPQGKMLLAANAQRLLKLAAARLRLKTRVGFGGRRQSYRTWQTSRIADKLVDVVEQWAGDLLEKAIQLPKSRNRRGPQRIATSRPSRTIPFGEFTFNGRKAIRFRPGRIALTAEEWLRRYKNRGGRGNPSIPFTKFPRPEKDLKPAPER